MDTASKWIKEMVGLPSYVGASIFGMAILDRGFVATLICMVIAVVIYNKTYEKIFPNYCAKNSRKKLFLLFVMQVIFWGGLFVVLESIDATGGALITP